MSSRIVIPDDFKDFDNNRFDTSLTKPCNTSLGLYDLPGQLYCWQVSGNHGIWSICQVKYHIRGVLIIAKFYENINHNLDSENMTWLVSKNFLDQWKNWYSTRREDHGPPKLTKSSLVHKLLESMNHYLRKKFGLMKCASLGHGLRWL